MAQIRSSSAELIAFFNTGDVPTADNFEDFIKTTAVHDGSLPFISGSTTSTGSFGDTRTAKLSGLGGGTTTTLVTNFIPETTNVYSIGSDTKYLSYIYAYTASIELISCSLKPFANNVYDLGSETLKYKKSHFATSSIDLISSSLIPVADDTFDLGTSALQWKDLYVDGIAYIDTIQETSIPSITGSVIVSGALLPGTDDSFDLGSSGAEWKDLYVDGTAYIDTLSISSLDNDIDIHSISASGQLLNISGTVHPKTDNTYDLGTSALQWKDLYVNGIAYIDTIGSSTGAPGVDAYIATATISTINASGSQPSSVTISGSFVPDGDDAYDLGSSAKQWKDIYIDGVANIDTIGAAADETANAYINIATLSQINASGSLAGNVTLSGSLIPHGDDTYNLGSSTKEWNDLYVDGVAYIDQISGSGNAGDSALTSSVHIVPGADDTYSLGSTGLEWKDLFIDGTATIDALSADTGSIGRISSDLIPTADNNKDLGSSTFRYAEAHVATGSLGAISSSLIPHKDNTYDLGSSGKEWKDLYIDGTANVDTLSADLASITTINTSLSGSTYSAVLTTSASVASIKFKNLPTTEAQARLIGTGSLYLGGPSGSSSNYLVVFTG